MYLATLVCPTSIPSLSSSPWILGAPHSGLARLISRINRRTSIGTLGRPGRRLDFQRQYDRKPARCHRSTVSGRTMVSASRAFGNSRQTQPRTSLSAARNGNRAGWPRRSTMICCRSTRTSASSAARDRNRSKTRPGISLMRPDIRASVARFSTPRQSDSIYDRDRWSSGFRRAGRPHWPAHLLGLEARTRPQLVMRSIRGRSSLVGQTAIAYR